MNIQYVTKLKSEKEKIRVATQMKNEISKKFHTLLTESSLNIKVFSKVIDKCVNDHYDFNKTNQELAFSQCRIKAERIFLDELTKLNRTNLLITNRENMKSLKMIVKHSILENIPSCLSEVLRSKREFGIENTYKNKNNIIRNNLMNLSN